MELICLGSSSKGNCYILKASDEVLILEAGIPLGSVKQALNWDISNIVGCVISHRHGDHSKFLHDYIRSGITTLASADVFDSKKLNTHCFCKEIVPSHGYKVGSFKIYAFSVLHDVPCLGFIISHDEMGKLLFVTDTMMLEYKLPKVNHIMLEANYSDAILNQNVSNGLVIPSLKERLLLTHMELKTTKGILLANDLSNTNEVILIHLSEHNSDAEQFLAEVKETIGKPVYVAKNGLHIYLSILPY